MKRSIAQGKYISSGEAKFYKSLGDLIKDYREWRGMSQESFAASLGISVRQLRNWEANRHRARIDNMHDLAEIAGIPMQVCTSLNDDQPVWYSLRKRRFALSSLEKELSSSAETLLRYHEQSGEAELLNIEGIATDKHISMILACHHDIYGSEKPLPTDVIKAAIRFLPEFNRIVLDCWGHYVGHQICLPITKDIYGEIKKQGSCEGYLSADKISDILALKQGVFFIYSTFSTCMMVDYAQNIISLRYLDKIAHKENYLLAITDATGNRQTYLSNVGFKLVGNYDRPPNKIHLRTYEVDLAVLMHPLGPCGTLTRMLNEEESKAKAGDMICNQQEMLPAPGLQEKAKQKDLSTDQSLNNIKLLHKFYLTGKMDAISNADPLKADVPLLADGLLKIRGDIKQQNKLMTEACTNSKCSLFSKTSMGNIVYNGTHRIKEGIIVQRFLCKACGKSFCSRSRSIFYGLRSPEEKIRQALNLFAKGMSMRGVGRALGVKADTVRHWLKANA